MRSLVNCAKNNLLEIVSFIFKRKKFGKISTVNGESERRYAKVFDVELERSFGSSPRAPEEEVEQKSVKNQKKLFFSFAQRASTSRRETES